MKTQIVIALILLTNCAYANTLAERLPAVLTEDADLVETYWIWLQTETGAPENTPLPPIQIQDLPNNARMALFYPTQFQRDEPLRIAVSPRAIERASNGERLLVIAELAHEMVQKACWENGEMLSRPGGY